MSNKYPGGIITSGASVGSSVAFDGNGDYLQVGSNAAFNFSASDCTIECWFFAGITPGSETEIVEFGTGSTSGDIQLIYDSGGQFTFGGSGQTKNRYTFPSGRWYYLAAVKSGVNWYLYIDGVQYVTQTSGVASSSNSVNIGSRNAGGNWVTGNIYNLRISNVARYSGATAAMANVLTTDANTKLWTCVGRTITDLSGNSFAITVGGNAYMSSYGPPGYVAYNPALGAATPGIWSVSDAIQAAQTRRWNMYDPYFNYTTLLLHGNGTNGAQNNTFLDSGTANSGSGFTITRNGQTTQGTFSPFSQTGWSNYIGSSNYLSVPYNANLLLNGTPSTVEGWFYLNATPGAAGSSAPFFCQATASGTSNWWCFADATNLYLGGSGDSNYVTTPTSGIPINQWFHLAVTFNSTTGTIWINGVQKATGTINAVGSSTSYSTFIGYIISGSAQNNYLNGYVSNVRVVKGTAVYTTGSNFTPSTTPLTAITNTQLLTCQSNRFVDNSASPNTITVNGTPSVQAFSPFLTNVAYTPTAQGGSGYFDGSGDNISVPSATALQLNTSVNWTIEAWVYPTTLSGDNGIIAKRGASTEYQLSHNSGIGLNIYTGATTYGSGKLLTVNQWQHCAATWDGTTLRFFVNGVQTPTTHTGISLPASSTNNFTVGANGTTEYFSGYICGARLVKGTAVYTASFTPPTAPLTAITNTSFLCNFTNAGIIDSTAKNVLETVSNAQISTTQSKFGGSSMSFNGTSDYLKLPSSQSLILGTGDFTIEAWIYPTSWNSNGAIVQSNGVSNGPQFSRYGSNNALGFALGGVSWIITDATLPSINTWTHVAVSRYGTTMKIFINGVQSGSTATNSSNFSAALTTVGSNGTAEYFAGYIDDLRVSRYARYTANFTPQTSQWQDQ